MVSKRTLNARNLAALGSEALAELLLEVSGGNALIQRRLRLALAAAEGAGSAAQEVRKRLAAIDRSRTYLDAAKRKALISDLEVQLRAISGPIAGADPGQACELLLRLLELSEGVLARCADSGGDLRALFGRAAECWGPIAQAAQLGPENLAEQAAELLAENTHGQFDGLVPVLKDALGDWGLKLLGSYLRQHGASDGSTYLLQIAVARGDVDGFLGQFSAEDLRWRETAASVAGHLLASGRAEQALEILDGATEDRHGWPQIDWLDSRIAVLDALSRGGEAQQLRWQWFSRSLSIPHLRAYLKRLDAFEDAEAEERALQQAEGHPDSLLGLQFLVEWPSLARAAGHVLSHGHKWDGDALGLHTAAADRLSTRFPLAATLLLRPMVFSALRTGNTRRYRHAAEHLRSCDQWASRIEDWQDHPDHVAYLQRLVDLFGTDWRFWGLVDG
ncbi:MAG: hypothetical protein VKI39_03140 [Synechococcus sp.]|nr:hypothetical protein [Synechococcus sp.]